MSEIRLADASSVGGKAPNLGELIGSGFPVPPGFVLPAQSYRDAMDIATVRGELAGLARPQPHPRDHRCRLRGTDLN